MNAPCDNEWWLLQAHQRHKCYCVRPCIMRMHDVSTKILHAPAHVELLREDPSRLARYTGSASSPADLARLRRGESFGARISAYALAASTPSRGGEPAADRRANHVRNRREERGAAFNPLPVVSRSPEESAIPGSGESFISSGCHCTAIAHQWSSRCSPRPR